MKSPVMAGFIDIVHLTAQCITTLAEARCLLCVSRKSVVACLRCNGHTYVEKHIRHLYVYSIDDLFALSEQVSLYPKRLFVQNLVYGDHGTDQVGYNMYCYLPGSLLGIGAIELHTRLVDAEWIT